MPAPATTGLRPTEHAALADSAHLLDTLFQREREALNRAVFELQEADRRTRDYARRYDALVRRIHDAERLRADRDQARARLAKFRERRAASASR